MTDTAPRIYVACLASYNNGVLHGRWIDASADVADMWPEINAMLRESKFPNVTVADYDATALAAGWRFDPMSHWYHPHDAAGGQFYGTAKEVCDGENLPSVMVPSAEEWAIHDHEGLGGDLGEYAGLAEVARRVAIIDLADERDIPAAVLMAFAHDYMSGEWDADDLESEIDDRYDGTAASWEAFTEEQFTETGGMEGVPERLQYYIDFKAMARDWELGGDWSAYRDGEAGDLYFFRSN